MTGLVNLSALAAAAATSGTDLVAVTQGSTGPNVGTTRKATLAQVFATPPAMGGTTPAAGAFTTVALSADPTTALQAATKQYADLNLPKSGGTMTGALVLAADPAAPLQAATKQYVDALPANSIGRNRITNGSFRINQRAYVSGTALAAGVYAHDRWKAGAGGCTYTFSALPNGYLITITAGSLQQVIEAANVEGGTYTASWAGTAQGRVNGGAYAASPFTVTGLAVGTAVTVEFNTGTLGSVQFEPGSTATAFDRVSLQKDLAECQRFFTPLTIYGGYLATAIGAGVYASASFPVTMRASPTVTLLTNSSTGVNSLAFTGRLSAATANGVSAAASTALIDVTVTASADL